MNLLDRIKGQKKGKVEKKKILSYIKCPGCHNHVYACECGYEFKADDIVDCLDEGKRHECITCYGKRSVT